MFKKIKDHNVIIFAFIQLIGMGPQNSAAGGMSQAQNQAQQQNPNLVAQLQRQMPNQPNMMGQQYQHQPPAY